MLNEQMHQYFNNAKKKNEIENQIRLTLIGLLNCHGYSYYFREQEKMFLSVGHDSLNIK